MTADEQAIREAIATWLRASAAGDGETVLGLMDDDVLFFVAGQAPFGKEAFAAAQQELGKTRIDATSHVREVTVSGDWAWCSTDLAVAMTPEDGGPAVRRSGNTLSVFRRLPDGRWVLYRDANLLAVER